MPLAQGNSALVVKALKDLKQLFVTMLWQSDDALDCIHYPAQDDFAGVTVSIPGFHLLDGRDVFVVLGIKGVQGMEHFVDRVQETLQVLAVLLGTPLH